MDLNIPKHINFLSKIPVLNNLDTDEIQELSKHLYVKEILENEMVFARLEKEQILYFVRYGKLKLELIGSEDVIYNKGDVFGEIAVINNNFRTGTVRAIEPTMLFCLNGQSLMNDTHILPKTALKIVSGLANLITGYLETADNISTHKLIEQGENDYVEFKSTLRYNLYTKKFDKEIEHAVLKTIAAFMNSSGGTLIIGVDDNKNVIGLEKDKFQDHDRMLLHLTKLIQERISINHTQFIRSTIEQSKDLFILRVDVKPATAPAYLVHLSDEVFYVRTGPSTTQMKVSEIFDYINNRFKN